MWYWEFMYILFIKIGILRRKKKQQFKKIVIKKIFKEKNMSFEP